MWARETIGRPTVLYSILLYSNFLTQREGERERERERGCSIQGFRIVFVFAIGVPALSCHEYLLKARQNIVPFSFYPSLSCHERESEKTSPPTWLYSTLLYSTLLWERDRVQHTGISLFFLAELRLCLMLWCSAVLLICRRRLTTFAERTTVTSDALVFCSSTDLTLRGLICMQVDIYYNYKKG